MMELLCSASLALRLGAIAPRNMTEHRLLRDLGHLLIRDKETPKAMFWPWAVNVADEITARSS
jgi:hypothetical protein